MTEPRFHTREEYDAWKAGQAGSGGQPSSSEAGQRRLLSAKVTLVLILIAIVLVVWFGLSFRSQRTELARLQHLEIEALQRKTEWAQRTAQQMEGAKEPTVALAIARAGEPYAAELKKEYEDAKRRREDFESAFRAKFGWLGF